MPALPNSIAPRPTFFTYFSALGGCLDYLGVAVSDAWLAGGSGVAFVMNMAANVDVASPVAWTGPCANDCHAPQPGMMVRLGANLGFAIDAVCGCPYGKHSDGDASRLAARDLVSERLAQGLPCMGYGLAYPEFFIISGYEDECYQFVMLQDGVPVTERKPWRELGSGIGLVRVQAVMPANPKSDEVVVAEALMQVTRLMAELPGEGMFVTGLRGFEMWAGALERGTAQDFGHRCNAATWAELRAQAAGFLNEARGRLPGRVHGLLKAAAGHYQQSADSLAAARDLHPVLDCAGCLQSSEAAGYIRTAGEAEQRGLPLLGQIASALVG